MSATVQLGDRSNLSNPSYQSKEEIWLGLPASSLLLLLPIMQVKLWFTDALSLRNTYLTAGDIRAPTDSMPLSNTVLRCLFILLPSHAGYPILIAVLSVHQGGHLRDKMRKVQEANLTSDLNTLKGMFTMRWWRSRLLNSKTHTHVHVWL